MPHEVRHLFRELKCKVLSLGQPFLSPSSPENHGVHSLFPRFFLRNHLKRLQPACCCTWERAFKSSDSPPGDAMPPLPFTKRPSDSLCSSARTCSLSSESSLEACGAALGRCSRAFTSARSLGRSRRVPRASLSERLWHEGVSETLLLKAEAQDFYAVAGKRWQVDRCLES